MTGPRRPASLPLVIVAMLCVLPIHGMSSGQPPAQGDWVVVGDESLFDEDLTVDGDVIVGSGGHLSLDNVTLRLSSGSPGAHSIIVREGGILEVRGNTTITSSDTSSGFGFEIRGAASLSDCTVTDLYGSRAQWPWAGGVQIYSDDVTVHNCTISNSGTYGIYMASSAASLDNITVINNLGAGVYAVGGSPTIVDSTVTLNGEGGISCDGCQGRISGTVVSFNGGHGVEVVDGSITLEGNRIAGNTGWGIRLLNADTSLANNSFTDVNNGLGRVWKGWETAVRSTDGNGNPLENCTVTIADGLNRTYPVQVTDSAGFTPYLQVPDLQVANSGLSSAYNPYRVLVEYGDASVEAAHVVEHRRQVLQVAIPPDLSVGSYQIEVPSEDPQGVVAFTVNIRNTEPVPVYHASLAVYLDGALSRVFNISVPSNSSKVIAYNWTGTGGDHVLRVVADPYGDLVETNETNNQVSMTFRAPEPGFAPVDSPPWWVLLLLAIAVEVAITVLLYRRLRRPGY